jgi:hypothetical protein
MTAVVTPAPTPVFTNADGVNAPEGGTEIGWTSQGTAPYPGRGKTPVFPSAANYTPATAYGWTVQSAAGGSDQNLVQNSGV